MTTSLKICLATVALCLLAASAAFGQNVAPELNITLGEQRVKFAPTRSFQEMRLEVVNSVGEIVFTHLTTEAEFDWNLRAGNSEALVPGLYRYTLALKFGEDQTRQHTGHFIVEKGQDQVWLTASEGTEVSGTVLSASRSGGRSITGLGSKDDKSVKRDVSGREIVNEKGDDQGNKLTGSTKAVKAALLGTANMVAKFDATGLPANVMNSTITEVGGNVGIGITTPGSILEMVRPGATDVVFRMANGTRAWSVGVSGSGDFWRIRDNTAGAARLTVEGGTGRVGIGTTAPVAMLHATGSAAMGVRGDSTVTNGVGVYGQADTGSDAYGVWGLSNSGYGVVGVTTAVTGVGVWAAGSGNSGTALRIQSGRIQVSGAGLGTGTPVFIHRAIAANIGFNETEIDHLLTNGDPNAILIVTPNFNPGGGAGVLNNHPIGVVYDGSKWRIFNQDAVAMPLNAAFNVLVIKP